MDRVRGSVPGRAGLAGPNGTHRPEFQPSAKHSDGETGYPRAVPEPFASRFRLAEGSRSTEHVTILLDFLMQ